MHRAEIVTFVVPATGPERVTMLLNFYASVYLAYIGIFQVSTRRSHSHRDRRSRPSTGIQADDDLATLLGNAYRGSGVLVGLLGASIIFCAIAPYGFGVYRDAPAVYFAIAKVALMLWVVQTIYHVRSRDLKNRWLKTRLKVEEARYRSLEDCPSMEGQALSKTMDSMLTGPGGQIAYNERKHHEYRAMEHKASNATKVGFAVSLAAAISHFFIHWDGLIFFTAFLPAGIGALHGVNAFLRLERLAHDHLRLARELKAAHGGFLAAEISGDTKAARQAAASAHQLLVHGNRTWEEIAQDLEVRAP